MRRMGWSGMVVVGAALLFGGAVLMPSPAGGILRCPRGVFPASGQTTAYQADKNDDIDGEVDVPDDGTVQAGKTLRYRDNGDGTITDRNTKLMWEKKSDDGGLHDKDNTYPWSGGGSQETIWDWLDDINMEEGTGFAGHNDWRIPNVKELQSIVDYERSNPAVDPVFNNGVDSFTEPSFSWSSTNASVPTVTWLVGFFDGDVNNDDKGLTFHVARCWAARDRSCAITPTDGPKPREVFAAPFRDRVVHHLLVSYQERVFEPLFIPRCLRLPQRQGDAGGQ